MGITPSELLNSSLILIDEDIIRQRLDFAVAPKLDTAIVILSLRGKHFEDDLGID